MITLSVITIRRFHSTAFRYWLFQFEYRYVIEQDSAFIEVRMGSRFQEKKVLVNISTKFRIAVWIRAQFLVS
jgi:hypothetical protein